MTTKEEILEQFDVDDLRDTFQYATNDHDWEAVESENTDYDEGTVTTTNTMKHKSTGRYFQYNHRWNSWADYDEDFSKSDIIEVEPKEVTVVQYVPISNS